MVASGREKDLCSWSHNPVVTWKSAVDLSSSAHWWYRDNLFHFEKQTLWATTGLWFANKPNSALVPEPFLVPAFTCLGSVQIAAEQSCFPLCRLCQEHKPEGHCLNQHCWDRAMSRSARQRAVGRWVGACSGMCWVVCARYLLRARYHSSVCSAQVAWWTSAAWWGGWAAPPALPTASPSSAWRPSPTACATRCSPRASWWASWSPATSSRAPTCTAPSASRPSPTRCGTSCPRSCARTTAASTSTSRSARWSRTATAAPGTRRPSSRAWRTRSPPRPPTPATTPWITTGGCACRSWPTCPLPSQTGSTSTEASRS